MAITVKNEKQIEYMKIAGRITGEVLNLMGSEVREGISTEKLDKIAEDFIRSKGAVPSFKGYGGFPASICTSVNEEVIHGIPGKRILKNGDIISIDVGAFINGFHGDAARTFIVGEISLEARKLIDVTEQSFFEGIKFAKAGNHLHQISASIQRHAEANGFSVVREYVGHGIGENMHEAPQIPNYKVGSRGPKLCKGMVLAIEPMINEGDYNVKVLADKWTVVTKDKKLSAHYENTVLITDGEPEILTLV